MRQGRFHSFHTVNDRCLVFTGRRILDRSQRNSRQLRQHSFSDAKQCLVSRAMGHGGRCCGADRLDHISRKDHTEIAHAFGKSAAGKQQTDECRHPEISRHRSCDSDDRKHYGSVKLLMLLLRPLPYNRKWRRLFFLIHKFTSPFIKVRGS